MTNHKTLFIPKRPDRAGIVSWIHIGDLHMTTAGEQNDLDLRAIVDEINDCFASGVSFVYLPGDVAEDGSRLAYSVVRQSLDQLTVPWCSIIGDHDVHEKSFVNFCEFMTTKKHYSFTIGHTRFLAMNAFDVPDPGSFIVSHEQLRWGGEELDRATAAKQGKILLLHCYPSDLKVGGDALSHLVREHGVQLIDMGHTHYNEIANDGGTIYTATRSTGQIEEGPVGFSVTNLDGEVLSWRFFELGALPAVMITSPSDERLMTDFSVAPLSGQKSTRVRAKIWHHAPIRYVSAQLAGEQVELQNVPDTRVWEGEIATANLAAGVYPLYVYAEDEGERAAEDTVRLRIDSAAHVLQKRAQRDQDNAIGAWPEHGLLGTQLGPNKNGRKW
jgi:Icc protein